MDEKFSYLTTFNTHKGGYWFLHMPFGLRMLQDVFQMHMNQITDCLLGIIAIHNDICIFSQTPEEHDRHLIQLMQTALKNEIVFNNSKCRIRQPLISFYTTVLTSQGMKPDHAKVQVLPTTDNQTKLQSFLAFIDYLQPFIPGLADNTTFL